MEVVLVPRRAEGGAGRLYIVMAYAVCHGLCSYGLCSYGLCSYGLSSYGLCRYGLYSYGPI